MFAIELNIVFCDEDFTLFSTGTFVGVMRFKG